MLRSWVKNVYSRGKSSSVLLGNGSTISVSVGEYPSLNANNPSFIPAPIHSFTRSISTSFVSFFYLLSVGFYTYSTVPTITNTGLK